MIGCFTKNKYVFIVDSVDHLVPENLSWIPTVIPHVSVSQQSYAFEIRSVQDSLFLFIVFIVVNRMCVLC